MAGQRNGGAVGKISDFLWVLFCSLACTDIHGAPEVAKANLFSALTGVLTQGGVPRTGITIQRSVSWRGEQHSDSAITDEQGRYQFAALLSASDLPRLPTEFNAFQQMVALVEGEKVLLWDTVKAEPTAGAELDGQHLVLSCDLDESLRFEHLLLNAIETRCRW